MRLIITITILIIIDLYALMGLKSVFSKNSFRYFFGGGYLLFALLSYMGFYALFTYINERPLGASLWKNLLIGFGFSFIVFKIIFAVFLIFDDIVRILNYILQIFSKYLKYTPSANFEGRRKFIINTGIGIASIPFAYMLYGITKGKYNYKVKKVVLEFEKLPKEFENFRIAQISDIHAGSFDSLEAVKKGVDLVNAQKPDVIFFTGDLINSDAREIEPFIDIFKSLKSEYGTFSILGNHDYGDYKRWKSKEEKEENFRRLMTYQKKMGFNLLKNENISLKKGKEQISILGVENWGKPPFATYGDIDKAIIGVNENDFKILLSHDPSHWDMKVLPHQTKIDLTLSGHTHGMQFGVEIPGIKWSPVKYIYPRWAGLYKKEKQYLYVNRGFGFIGFPGRVGMWPEITIIELKNK